MQPLSRWFFLLALAPGLRGAEPFADPKPPKFEELADQPAPLAQGFDRLTFHAKPKPLPQEAHTSDWPRVLGPNDDATSPETHLLHDFSPAGPPLVWEVRKGEGYTSPAIAGGFAVIFHALDGKETIEVLDAETGRRFWSHQYPIAYKDRYGFANGPRGSPVIADGRVVTVGVTCVMTCLDLKTGRLAWQRDLQKEFNVPQDFFGHGGSPMILGGKVIVNVGGKEGPAPDDDTHARMTALAKPGLCVGAFDLKNGKLVWGVKDAWGASYASPVRATIRGREVVAVYAGGESNPATGGLLCLDPKDGAVLSRHPWRAAEYIQAIGSSPVVIAGKNAAFISTAYPKGRPLGGVMIGLGDDFKTTELWKSGKFATHWMNPVHDAGFLYGIDGETEQAAQLVCVEAASGSEKWRKEVSWDDEELSRKNGGRPAKMGILRASLLRVDGKTLCLGETGALLWLDLTPEDAKVGARAQLFYAQHTWCLPAVSRGLLYVMQNERELVRESGGGQRILCYDLRGN
jgi:outer membrane protein assembly factor BamB